MSVYPSTVDVIEANKIALQLTLDKHPHKLIRSAAGIQHLIDEIRKDEAKGLTYQAARFIKQFTVEHFFGGANHRTAYLITLQFLTQNGMRLKTEQPKAVDEFMNEIGAKEIEKVQEWIEQYLVHRP